MPTEPKAGQSGTPPSALPKLRDVVVTTQFKKDFKREEKGRHRATLRHDLQVVVDKLADDIPLPQHMVDHSLGGIWKDHRDCHIKPDLVLIYRKVAAAGEIPETTGEAETQPRPPRLTQRAWDLTEPKT